MHPAAPRPVSSMSTLAPPLLPWLCNQCISPSVVRPVMATVRCSMDVAFDDCMKRERKSVHQGSRYSSRHSAKNIKALSKEHQGTQQRTSRHSAKNTKTLKLPIPYPSMAAAPPLGVGRSPSSAAKYRRFPLPFRGCHSSYPTSVGNVSTPPWFAGVYPHRLLPSHRVREETAATLLSRGYDGWISRIGGWNGMNA
ncbi:uncharacterized protein BJ171DRAFT_183833 [Polychytrium aggregatum]|uniref:uncharacterized protein n=1 Tax=Polychytrium aggregatum TaxID=110093 RepID=UPI0022FE9674|nr:uncharacterized protein BJ171DRAFT_183833 [Polychytrium aggregatum]KAI9202375.1 hypothetical protein BJ171DRAFT_183833 [Polychytrium aggregatum]